MPRRRPTQPTAPARAPERVEILTSVECAEQVAVWREGFRLVEAAGDVPRRRAKRNLPRPAGRR